MRIGLVSSAFPPSVDGIGDYTAMLAETLASQPSVELPVEVFTSRNAAPSQNPGVNVSPFFDTQHPSSFGDLSALANVRNLDWLVLQYNPFGFGRWGYCPWVPKTLRVLKREHPNLRVAIMFHETVVPRWPWKFAVMYSWQWPLFRSVCRSAHTTFVSTTRWTPQVCSVAHVPIHHLPVGSNIPLRQTSLATARRHLLIDDDAVVLGIFGSAHVSRLLGWIAAAARRISQEFQKTCILYVGPDGKKVQNECHDIHVINAGPLPREDVGLHFSAMDVCLAPFSDGLTTRRTSMISMIQHGVPVASASLPFTDPPFGSFTSDKLLRSRAANENEFAADVSSWIRSIIANREKHEIRVADPLAKTFEWIGIVDRMLSTLSEKT